MSVNFIENTSCSTNLEPINRKDLRGRTPTWCPGCGDHGVLGAYFKVIQELGVPHERLVTLAGIGCSSRFPYFVNTHGGHFLHGRSVPFASGLNLARPDLKVFVFGGDGDGFSIGGNHLDHTARKNFDLTYVIMDNNVYGMTKNQTSPTTPKGQKSKTDPSGALDEPINPMKRLVACGATFVARTATTNIRHMTDMMMQAAQHKGFAVVEVMSECTHFNLGSFDSLQPRKGGTFPLVPEEHDVTDSAAAYALADQPWPGLFGVFLQIEAPTKVENESILIANARKRWGEKSDREHLAATFAALR